MLFDVATTSTVSDPVLLAIIALVGTTITSIITAIITYLTYQKTTSTHNLVNSQSAALLAVTTSSATAEGKLAGEQSQRDRTAAATEPPKPTGQFMAKVIEYLSLLFLGILMVLFFTHMLNGTLLDWVKSKFFTQAAPSA